MPRCQIRRTSWTILVGWDVGRLPEWEPPASAGGRTIHQPLLLGAWWCPSGAWRRPSVESGTASRCGQLTGLNNDLAFLNLPRIFNKPALRRSRCARAVAVVDAAVTRTHEQTGLREPANRASQMHAVDGKHLKFIGSDIPHPTSRVRCLAIGWRYIWIPKGGEPCLAFRKLADSTQWHPGEIGVPAAARNRGEKKSHDGHCQRESHQSVEQNR